MNANDKTCIAVAFINTFLRSYITIVAKTDLNYAASLL